MVTGPPLFSGLALTGGAGEGGLSNCWGCWGCRSTAVAFVSIPVTTDSAPNGLLICSLLAITAL